MSFECSGDDADDVYDLNIPLSGITVAEQILCRKFRRKLFYKPEDTLNEFVRQLKNAKYVCAALRRYLCYLNDCFSGEVKILAEMRLSVNEKRYINVDERKKALELLLTWKNVIALEGIEPCNAFFL